MKEEEPLHTENFEKAFRVAYLLAGYIRKTLTAREREELDSWLEESEENIALFEELTDEEHVDRALKWYEEMDEERKAKVYERLRQRLHFVKPKEKKGLRWLSLSIAAAVLLIIGTGIVLWLQSDQKPATTIVRNKEPNDASPGRNTAVLVLANGKSILLDSAANGRIAEEGSLLINKADSSLVYNEKSGSLINHEMHELLTLRGRQYSLSLSDGTRVWLNASSSLRFPASFGNGERVVELQGEGYFEVVHKAAQPFNVKAGDVMIKDLGTAFNINSYGDEEGIITTLVEGSLQVISSQFKDILKPGEQGITINEKTTIHKVNTAAATGWKKGFFHFQNTSFSTVLKELERWYDIEIENKSTSTEHLNAIIERNVPLSKILQLLEGQGALHYRWEGRRVVVTR